MPVVKLFTPGGCAFWLLTELNSSGGDRAYGLCDLGTGRPELRYVYLFELEYPQRGVDDRIIRDVDFIATTSLSAYAKDARRRPSGQWQCLRYALPVHFLSQH
jgi:hypothetical protein